MMQPAFGQHPSPPSLPAHWGGRDSPRLPRLAAYSAHQGESSMPKPAKRQRRRHGEKHQCSRYTDSRVTAALDLLDSGMSQRAVAARLGIPRTTLQAWASGAARAPRPTVD